MHNICFTSDGISSEWGRAQSEQDSLPQTNQVNPDVLHLYLYIVIFTLFINLPASWCLACHRTPPHPRGELCHIVNPHLCHHTVTCNRMPRLHHYTAKVFENKKVSHLSEQNWKYENEVCYPFQYSTSAYITTIHCLNKCFTRLIFIPWWTGHLNEIYDMKWILKCFRIAFWIKFCIGLHNRNTLSLPDCTILWKMPMQLRLRDLICDRYKTTNNSPDGLVELFSRLKIIPKYDAIWMDVCQQGSGRGQGWGYKMYKHACKNNNS